MKIRVLGTRGEIKPFDKSHKNHSGVLINNELLLDLGEKKFLRYSPRYILITHLHPDHAFFIARDEKIPEQKIYAPEKLPRAKNIIPLAKKTTIGSYSITPIPTVHSKLVKSQGYLVERAGKRIFYSSDMIWIKKKYWHKLKNLDLVITEGSYINTGGVVRRDKQGNIFGHTGIPNLIKFFAPFTRKIVLMHFGSWFFRDGGNPAKRVKSLGSSDLEIIVASDGVTLSV